MSRLVTKVERAALLIEETAVRRMQRLNAVLKCRCGGCGSVMFEYRGPAYVVHRCRHCAEWNVLDSEQEAPRLGA